MIYQDRINEKISEINNIDLNDTTDWTKFSINEKILYTSSISYSYMYMFIGGYKHTHIHARWFIDKVYFPRALTRKQIPWTTVWLLYVYRLVPCATTISVKCVTVEATAKASFDFLSFSLSFLLVTINPWFMPLRVEYVQPACYRSLSNHAWDRPVAKIGLAVWRRATTVGVPASGAFLL